MGGRGAEYRLKKCNSKQHDFDHQSGFNLHNNKKKKKKKKKKKEEVEVALDSRRANKGGLDFPFCASTYDSTYSLSLCKMEMEMEMEEYSGRLHLDLLKPSSTPAPQHQHQHQHQSVAVINPSLFSHLFLVVI
ncbi:hypothetical protein ACSBR1_034557 [Camellia fascicularis]